MPAHSRRHPDSLLRRGAVFSGGLHLLVLLSLIVVMPQRKPPEPPEPPAVEMDFVGPPAASQKADQATPNQQPPAPVPNPAPPSPTPPEPIPTEEPPPPPPPPPPAPPPPEAQPTPIPPLPLPPKLQAPSPEPVRAPPPMPSPPAPSQTMSPPTPTPMPALPQMTLPSHMTQPNKTRNAVPDTHSLLATLDKFRTDQKQTHAPHSRANPAQGGAPTQGRDITASLSAGEQRAIGGEVRRCYAEDTEARNYAQFQAHLTVTVDAAGEARMVEFSAADAARMASDPSYRALAERARAAVMNPLCAKLPLPPGQLGQVHQLKFVFRP
jgi:neural Wiskott-Aldrich syndrome protein